MRVLNKDDLIAGNKFVVTFHKRGKAEGEVWIYKHDVIPRYEEIKYVFQRFTVNGITLETHNMTFRSFTGGDEISARELELSPIESISDEDVFLMTMQGVDIRRVEQFRGRK